MKAMKPLRALQPCRPGELCHVCFPNSSFPLGRNRPKGPGSRLPARAGDEAKLWHGQSRVWARFGNRFDLLSTKTLPFAGAGAVTPKAYFNFASIPLSQGGQKFLEKAICLPGASQAQPGNGQENARKAPGISSPGKGRTSGCCPSSLLLQARLPHL